MRGWTSRKILLPVYLRSGDKVWLDTKDAFWHSKNVTVMDSEINGEYLAWFSED